MSDLTLSLWSKKPLVFINGDLPEHVREDLDDELSYEVQGAEYSDSFQDDTWDGKEYLLRQAQDGTWFFPVGVVDRVRDVLDAHGLDYEVEGISRPGRGPVDYEWNSDIELRDYQQEAVDLALQYGSGVIAMPTGAGKTITGIWLIKELGWPAIVLVDNSEVADQWVEKLENILDVDVARYYGGDRENGDVMVALYQSIYMDGEVVDDVRLSHMVAVPDECHSTAADTFYEVMTNVSAKYRFGLSATPTRADNAELKVFGCIGPLICDLSVGPLIDRGDLAEPEWDIIDAPASGRRYHDWQVEYKEEIVKNEARNNKIVAKANELAKPCLITVERIAHGERLASKLGDDAAFVHGSASDRDENIQAFRDGGLDILVATRGIVGEGFNVPEIESFIVAGGMKSEVSMIQQVGRALRPDTGTATIVDFYDQGRRIGDHSSERVRTYDRYYQEFGPLA